MEKLRELKAVIVDAFRDVPYPGDQNLFLHQCEECAEFREFFKGKIWTNWKDRPEDFFVNADFSFMSVLSPAAFQYYMPLLLLGSLEGELAADLANSLTQSLGYPELFKETKSEGELQEIWKRYRLHLSTFSSKQLQAIKLFLEFIVKQVTFLEDEVACAERCIAALEAKNS